jgi:hypothetical protein
VFGKLSDAPVVADSKRVGRHASAAAAIIDNQTGETTKATRLRRRNSSACGALATSAYGTKLLFGLLA